MNGWNLLAVILTLTLFICLINIDSLLRQLAEQWAKCRAVSKMMVILLVCGVVWYAGTKPTNTTSQSSSYIATLPDVGLVQSGSSMLSGGISIEDAPMASGAPALTSNQMVNGYAITQVTTGTVSWLSYPESYTVLSNWFAYGLHDDVKHLEADPQFDIYYSTNIASDLFVASSGTLSFDAVKGTPFISTNGLPDGSELPYAAVLHGPLSTIGPDSRVWYSVSPTNYCMTWENLYAGRLTNNPVTFQMEVLENQDMIYRYLLSSNCVNSQVLTNFLVGLQANCPAGGESLSFTSTNVTPQNFELYWTSFGYLNPALEHHDADSLTSSSEVFTHKTNPHMPDTDLDGLWDDDEIAAETKPNDRDSDNDNIPDGSDPNPLTSDTTDNDADSLPDAWEEYWFGSTNVTDSGENDTNDNGASDLQDMLTGTDPAFSACAVMTSQGIHSFSWTDLAEATNYTAVITCGTTTNGIYTTDICSITVTDDFTSAEHTVTVTALCSTNKLTHTASESFRQPSEPNLTVWKITDPIALDSTAVSNTVRQRTFNVNRVRDWGQYYITANYQSAEEWELDGLTLDLSGDVTALSTNASSVNDSLWVDAQTDAESIIVTLRTTESNSLGICSQPLYLIAWSPELCISSNANITATEDGHTLVLISDLGGEESEVDFTVNTDGRPSNTALTLDQILDLIYPFGYTDAVSFTTDENNYITGGAFIEGSSGITQLSGSFSSGSGNPGGGGTQTIPPTDGIGDITLCRIAPVISSFSGGMGCECKSDMKNLYPLDTSCFMERFYNNYTIVTCSSSGPGGVSVSLGLDGDQTEDFIITINDEEDDEYDWKEEDDEANVTVKTRSSGKEIWSGSVPHQDYDKGGCSDSLTRETTTVENEGGCGCDDGCENGDCGGNDKPNLGCLQFRLSTGSTGYKKSGGFIWFQTETPPAAITPSLLNLTLPPSVNVESNETATTLICVDNTNANGRCISITELANGITLSYSRYDEDLDATPEGAWELTKDTSGSFNFIHTDSSGNTNQNYTYSYSTDLHWTWEDAWTETDNITGLTRVRTESSDHKGILMETFDSFENKLTGSFVITDTIGSGVVAVERVTDRRTYGEYGSEWNDIAYYYHEDGLNPNLNGKLKLRENDNGSWDYHLWNSSGNRTLEVESRDGAALPDYLRANEENLTFDPSANYHDMNAVVTVTEYSTHAGNDSSYLDARKPRTVSEYRVANGTPVLTSRTWHKYNRGTTNIFGTSHSIITHTAIRTVSQNSAITDATNGTSVDVYFLDTDDGDLMLEGRPLYRRNEGGSTTSWSYDLDVDDSGDDILCITAFTGTETSSAGVTGKSTYDYEEMYTSNGLTSVRATLLNSVDADPVLSWEANTYDAKGRLISTDYSDGTVMSNFWTCCALDHTIERDGTVREHFPDPTSPNWAASGLSSQGSLPGAGGYFTVVERSTDELGREISSVRSVRNSSFMRDTSYAQQITTTEYPEHTSHLRVTTDHLGIVTTNKISLLTENNVGYIIEETDQAGIKTTSKRPVNGEPIVTTEWADPASGDDLKKVEKWVAEILDNGYEKRTAYVQYDDGEWLTQSETVKDLLGRTVISSRAGASGVMLTTSNVYNNAGLLVQTVNHDGSSIVYDYDELNERIATIRVGAEQTLDFNPLSFALSSVIALDKYIIWVST